MPIIGHTFFGNNSLIFGPIGLKIFMGTQETIIYRLVMRHPSYDAYFSFSITEQLSVTRFCLDPIYRLTIIFQNKPFFDLFRWPKIFWSYKS